jgi:DNA-binding Lrp family transcriptional regulator
MIRNKSNRTQSSIAKIRSPNLSSYHKQSSKLLNSTSLKIISELLRKPNISSSSLAKKVQLPLSTLQRRRAKLEEVILQKTYTFDYKSFGARVGDLIINVDKGKSDDIAQSILKKHRNNVTYCHTRIDSTHSVLAHIIYKETAELYYIIEDIKTVEYVNSVSWSETVDVIGDNNSEVISALFNE